MQFSHHFALKGLLLSSVLLALECSYPAYIPNCGFDALNVELAFEANRQAM